MNVLSAKSYEFELITPLIMTGAKKDKIEFRTQSIIGILRWWFRFYKACEVKDLKKLKEVEIILSERYETLRRLEEERNVALEYQKLQEELELLNLKNNLSKF